MYVFLCLFKECKFKKQMKNNKKNSKSEILISVFGRSKSGVEGILMLEKCGGEKVNLHQQYVALLKCHLHGSAF
jgi:hypothetical protein